jgi:predicted HicB family RNase H-like nuclease
LHFKVGNTLDGKFFVVTLHRMTTKKRGPGQPPKPAHKAKGELLQIRVNPAEKEAFSTAADLDGKSLSAWVRDRLRRLAREELEGHGRTVAFLPSKKPES